MIALTAAVTTFVACSAPLGPSVDAISVTYTNAWAFSVDNDLDMVYVLDDGASMAQVDAMMSTLQTCRHQGVALNIRTKVLSATGGELLTALATGVAGFPRPEAYLGVVVVSAGDDSSAGPVSGFVQDLQLLKADPYQILVIGALGPSSTRLTEFVDAFPTGLATSIDDEHWTAEALQPFCTDRGEGRWPPCVPSTLQACVLTEHLTTVEGTQDLVVPPCAGDAGDSFCWSLQPATVGCLDTQDALIVANQPTGSDPANYGVRLLISCQLPSGTN